VALLRFSKKKKIVKFNNMSKELKLGIIIILLVIIGIFGFYFLKRSEEKIEEPLTLPQNMQLISSAFLSDQSIPQKYTCDGDNINPPLEIAEVPEEAKSLALIVDDPDAPMRTFVHWIIWNIPPAISLIGEDSVPEGAVQGRNDFGKNSYGGPCPPSGIHHYHFKIYALDIQLDLKAFSKKDDLEKAMEGHILDRAELIGLYQR